MLPMQLASLPPPPPPPPCTYETTWMLQTIIQDIDDIPISYYLSLFPLAPILAGRHLFTSYSSVPIAGWLLFVRLLSLSCNCPACHYPALHYSPQHGQLQTFNNYGQRGEKQRWYGVYLEKR